MKLVADLLKTINDLIEEFRGRVPVFSVPLYDVFPTKASLVYGVKNMQGYFDTRARIKKEGSKMKS